MTSRSSVVSSTIKACYQVGRPLLRDSAELEQLSGSASGKASFCKNAIMETEQALAKELSILRPEYHILTKHGGYIATSPFSKDAKFLHRWVINPMDGVENFANGHTSFAVCISLERITIPEHIKSPENFEHFIQNDNVPAQILLGVCYLPALRNTYWAEKGIGAYVVDSYGDQKKISVRDKKTLKNAIFATSFDSAIESEKNIKFARNIRQHGATMRFSGSIAVDCMDFARGRWDGVMSQNMSREERSALMIIMREAGADIFSLQKQQSIIGVSELPATSEFISASKNITSQIKSISV